MKFIVIALLMVINGSLLANERLSVKQMDLRMEMKDGVKLDCSLFKPEGDMPSDGWPVIIYCHGYGKSKEDMKSLAAGQSSFGYITFTFSMRGQGLSEGKSNFISRIEMEDFKQVVEQLKKRKDIDKKEKERY